MANWSIARKDGGSLGGTNINSSTGVATFAKNETDSDVVYIITATENGCTATYEYTIPKKVGELWGNMGGFDIVYDCSSGIMRMLNAISFFVTDGSTYVNPFTNNEWEVKLDLKCNGSHYDAPNFINALKSYYDLDTKTINFNGEYNLHEQDGWPIDCQKGNEESDIEIELSLTNGRYNESQLIQYNCTAPYNTSIIYETGIIGKKEEMPVYAIITDVRIGEGFNWMDVLESENSQFGFGKLKPGAKVYDIQYIEQPCSNVPNPILRIRLSDYNANKVGSTKERIQMILTNRTNKSYNNELSAHVYVYFLYRSSSGGDFDATSDKFAIYAPLRDHYEETEGIELYIDKDDGYRINCEVYIPAQSVGVGMDYSNMKWTTYNSDGSIRVGEGECMYCTCN